MLPQAEQKCNARTICLYQSLNTIWSWIARRRIDFSKKKKNTDLNEVELPKFISDVIKETATKQLLCRNQEAPDEHD